jgi:hypothetical protein
MPSLERPTTHHPPLPGSSAASPSSSRLAGSASVLVRDLLVGPRRPATVVASGRAASYVDVDGRLLAVVAPSGVRLPCALVLTAGSPVPTRPGAVVSVGEGVVGGGPPGTAREIGVARWFDPRVRVDRYDGAAVARLARVVRAHAGADRLLPAGAAERLASGLTAAAGPARIVADLVGRGAGLTPSGDDLLAGALAALRAVRSPAAGGLAAAIGGLARECTTRLSAALLEAAGEAAVVPEAEAVVLALASGPGRVEGAALRLLALGHTSGWHLAAGVAVGAAHALTVAAGAPGVPARSVVLAGAGVVGPAVLASGVAAGRGSGRP